MPHRLSTRNCSEVSYLAPQRADQHLQTQIAELMEINRQSVANLLFRALGSLKSQMAFCTYWLTSFLLDF